MGAKTLANAFRLLEIEIERKGLTESIKAEVAVQIKKLERLIALMEEMNYSNSM
ncbi:hypothetical protein D3C85_1881080 [compost metagenome]